MNAELELAGIEADNLLGFLAVLGLLRSLDTERPEWQARISWRTAPMSARLHLASSASEMDIAEAADGGATKLGKDVSFDESDLKFTRENFRSRAEAACDRPTRSGVLAALGSDGALKRFGADAGNEIEPTPLCFILGQGHQHFLERLQSYSAGNACGPESIRKALFCEWRYDDKGKNFRWDPIEDRRYAYQSGDPSEQKNKIGSVPGANRLAAIGFPSLTSVPTSRGLATIGTTGRPREIDICWPLTWLPVSLSGLTALLAHPALTNASEALEPLGVAAIARARRIQVGKYFSIERARFVLFDRSSSRPRTTSSGS